MYKRQGRLHRRGAGRPGAGRIGAERLRAEQVGAARIGAEFLDRADDVIEAGRARGLVHEATIRHQLVEPEALHRGRKKALQAVDSRGHIGRGAAIDCIRADALRLSPEPRHGIVHAAVGEHRIDHHTALWIEPVDVGKGDQAGHRCRPRASCQLCPAVEQERPFVVMAGLADAALDSGRGCPILGEKLTQRAARGIDEPRQAKLRDPIRHAAPSLA